MLKALLLLAAAGAIGTIARWGVYAGSRHLPGIAANLPLATLTVNTLGSFAFGLVFALTEPARGAPISPATSSTRLLVLTGFMGAFTTFSTFAFETGQYLRQGQTGLALANVAANNLIGLAAVLLGLWIAHR